MAKAASSIDACQFKSMSAQGASSSVEPCTTFKPLYSSEAGSGSIDNVDDQPNDPEAILQTAYQNGFQKGQQHGCQEALAMAKASLSPSLTAFINSYKNLLDQSGLSESTIGDNIMELALLIVDKIIEQPAVTADQDLAELKTSIINTLLETNRLCLNMNPEDVSELEAIWSEDGLDVTSHPQIIINKNSAIQPGELRVDIQSEDLEVVDKKILNKLSRILDNESPSTE